MITSSLAAPPMPTPPRPELPNPPGPRGDAGATTSMKDVAEMLFRVRGVLADGVVTDQEARALAAFVRARPEVGQSWPGDVLLRRLESIFDDGRVDEGERKDLEFLLSRILEADGGSGTAVGTSPLPLDDPPPIVRFRDRTFVFAGTLASGSLGRCHRQVVRLGGSCVTTVTPETDYLVLGGFPGPRWEETALGEEIFRALAFRATGAPIAIVSEEEFSRGLPHDAEQGPRRRP